MIKEDVVSIIVQVNGKVRATVDVGAEIALDKAQVLRSVGENERVATWIKGNKIKKEIFVPGKLVNFVV
jgi:leucyl-tRNA synthetase